MNYTELIAKNSEDYVAIVLRLLRDDGYWMKSASWIDDHFIKFINSNNQYVAKEWAEFFINILK